MTAVDTPARLARFLCSLEYAADTVEATVQGQFPDASAREVRDAVTRAVAARERAEAAIETQIEQEGRDAAA